MIILETIAGIGALVVLVLAFELGRAIGKYQQRCEQPNKG
jgi:hypothetical protein